MTTIVMNTMNGAVTEYTWAFQSLTPTHAGSAMGLYALGGSLDLTNKIIGALRTGKTLAAESTKKAGLEMVFLAMKGSGTSTLTVHGEDVSYSYQFTVQPKGVSRVKPGRGFRENYFAFEYSNTDGADFQVDQIEVDNTASTTRRTQ